MRSLLRVFRPACMARSTTRAMGTMNIEEAVLKPSVLEPERQEDTSDTQNETTWNTLMFSPNAKPNSDTQNETTWNTMMFSLNAKPNSDAASSASPNSGFDAGIASAFSCYCCGQPGHQVKECPSLARIPVKICPCGGGVCKVLVAKTQQNAGRPFYKCPLREDEGACGFFKWCDGKVNSIPNENSSLDMPCPCGAGLCVIRTAKTTLNLGRQFYKCPSPVEESCGFFKWCDKSNHALSTSDPADEGLRCNKEGHRAKDYFSAVKNSAVEGHTDLFQTSGVDSFENCYKCGQVGHRSKDCPWAVRNSTRDDNAASFQSSKAKSEALTTCFRCGGVGHWARNCSVEPVSNGFTKRDGGENKVSRGCLNCGSQDHWAKDCPHAKKPRGYGGQTQGLFSGGSGGRGKCFKCGGDGHWAKACTHMPRAQSMF